MTDLEKDILKNTQLAITASIREVLTKYDSPLVKLVKDVVIAHNEELKKTITESFEQVIRTEEFKQSIVSAFSHKVARTVISNNDGMFEKVSNDLKQDAVFKAKMALAVSTVVEEVLRERKTK
jgi:hypothetical protein